jgi:hypothetical protein
MQDVGYSGRGSGDVLFVAGEGGSKQLMVVLQAMRLRLDPSPYPSTSHEYMGTPEYRERGKHKHLPRRCKMLSTGRGDQIGLEGSRGRRLQRRGAAYR